MSGFDDFTCAPGGEMNQRLSVSPNVTAPQPAGQRRTKGATEQAAPGTSDPAVLPLTDLLRLLHCSDTGLSTSDAAAILKTVGPNRIDAAAPRRLLAAFIGRCRNPLVLVLLFAAAVSAFTGDAPSFVIITAIVLMSVILDVAQEHRAEIAAERLREQVSLSVKALRDGQPVDIPAVEIVPGDIVLLAAGDLVPADSRLIEARDLYVNEALLTGESYPAEKETVPAVRNRQGAGSGDRAQNPARLDRRRTPQAARADRL
jgi:Mg2+-importing ATPase